MKQMNNYRSKNITKIFPSYGNNCNYKIECIFDIFYIVKTNRNLNIRYISFK